MGENQHQKRGAYRAAGGLGAQGVQELLPAPEGFGAAVLTSPAFLVSLGIFVLTAVLAFKKAHPILLVLLSAALGIGAGYLLL